MAGGECDLRIDAQRLFRVYCDVMVNNIVIIYSYKGDNNIERDNTNKKC